MDYGTISTAAAVRTGDRVELLEIDSCRHLPASVGVDDDGEFVTGRDAVALARSDPGRVERNPKRALAAGSAVRLGGWTVDAVDLVAATLRRVTVEALGRFDGRPPSRVVLTHPVRSSSTETDRLLVAATRAGLAGLEIVAEPVAAAAYYGASGPAPVPVDGHIAVYHLGSAFDATVLRRTPTSFEPRGAGHLDIGGETVDEAMRELVARHARATDPDAWDGIWAGAGIRGHVMQERLREAKEALSSRPWVAVAVDGIPNGIRVTRRGLERAVEHQLVATVEELLRTVREAGVDPTALAAVYLTGGASRMPRISELIHERTGRPAGHDGDPQAVVALGALAELPVMAAAAPVVAVPTALVVETPVEPVAGPTSATVSLSASLPGGPAGAPAAVTSRLKPVLVGMGMAAIVAGITVPIALISRSASAQATTVSPPVVVAPPTGATTAPAAAPSATAVAPTAAAATAPASPPPAQPGLDARHAALLASLDDVGGVRWPSCIAYPAAETAVYVTAIQCSPSDPSLKRNVVFYRLGDDSAYSAMYRTSTGNVSGSGTCGDGADAATTWSDGSAPKGFLVCRHDPDTGEFRMAWASSGSLVAGVISDPGAATTYAWWAAHAATLP